jgi:hypothetical protein
VSRLPRQRAPPRSLRGKQKSVPLCCSRVTHYQRMSACILALERTYCQVLQRRGLIQKSASSSWCVSLRHVCAWQAWACAIPPSLPRHKGDDPAQIECQYRQVSPQRLRRLTPTSRARPCLWGLIHVAFWSASATGTLCDLRARRAAHLRPRDRRVGAPHCSVFAQLGSWDFLHRARSGSGARRGLGKRGRCRSMEGDVAFLLAPSEAMPR